LLATVWALAGQIRSVTQIITAGSKATSGCAFEAEEKNGIYGIINFAAIFFNSIIGPFEISFFHEL